MAKTAIGSQGSWFATVNGERLPCVHDRWCYRDSGKMLYHDRFIRLGERQCNEFVQSMESKRRVILTHSKIQDSGDRRTAERLGYVAIFSIEDVRVDETGLHFRFIDRLEELA